MGNEKIGKVRAAFNSTVIARYHLVYKREFIQRHAREMISCNIEARTIRNVKFHRRKKNVLSQRVNLNGEENRSLARSGMFDEKNKHR